MASLTQDRTKCSVIIPNPFTQWTARAGGAITIGQPIYIVAATGQWALADGSALATAPTETYIASATVKAGDALTGWGNNTSINLGADLDAADFGDPIYVSNTAGELTLVAAESDTEKVVARVRPAHATWSVDRVAYIVFEAGTAPA